MKPIFIFSLPRAGSTLAQRIIAAHEAVDTQTEPWLLLPFCYALRGDGAYAEYSHSDAAVLLREFCKRLPEKEADYYEAVADMSRQLYAKACRKPGATHFLDKTPRYHLIVDEVMAMFPEAKFIFLWRNPLAVISSILDTWGKGGWNLYRFEIDLYEGLGNLVSAYSRNVQHCCSVRYEDLVDNPESEIGRIFDYLGLAADVTVADRFKDVELTGKVGDKIGYERYKALTSEPLDKWRKILSSPLRRWWCRGYLKWIGRERLAVMGYDVAQLERDLFSVRSGWQGFGRGIVDFVQFVGGKIFCWIEPFILRDKVRRLGRKRVYLHR